jgi:TetR/AcrR family transcriptional regulator
MNKAAARRSSRKPATRDLRDTRADIFFAAAQAFSTRGFDGVGVDDIARDAGVNKAMIYYHFEDKLTLYREIVRDMLRETGNRLATIANGTAPADRKIDQFIDMFIELKDSRGWMPTMMLREMAEGAPHLDLETFGLMRNIFGAFTQIIGEGQAQGLFRRDVQPVLAYLSVIGPLLLNAARERAAGAPGRSKLPMFVQIPKADLVSHLRHTAQRMLAKD